MYLGENKRNLTHQWIIQVTTITSNCHPGQNAVCVCWCCCSGLVFTMMVSLVFILLLRYIAGVLLWLVVFGIIAAVGFGECGVCFVHMSAKLPACFTFWLSRPSWRVVMAICDRYRFVSPYMSHPFLLPRCVYQVSGTATGSTALWEGSRVLMSPSLISASIRTSAFTFSSARRGSSSVCRYPVSFDSLFPLLSQTLMAVARCSFR